MAEKTFGNLFFVALAIVFVPMFLAFRYFENQGVMEALGLWNTFLMAMVLSIVPAVLICIAVLYRRK